ncbi:MAG: T9SS type A sorting domain-containing protein [Flavobacteriales bacterium]|nr:T9SS type A sorting domain-containing protein [Flavobacteriales bacterium]
MRSVLLPCALLVVMALQGQGDWSWEERAPLPMPTANNAVCAGVVDGDTRVYSFGGIGSGLARTAIHRKAYRYSTLSDSWTVLPDIPDTSGKIASAANVVDGVAYVIGGYHVLAGSPYEISSDRVHRLDLVSEQWLEDGAPIPTPIDDQVQVVWRDSLIYVITGWSNVTNVAAVQIYDPSLDAWSIGTSVPNNNLYKVFGASGCVLGDTIFYYGGASLGSNFPAQDELRKGVIDPNDPTAITWSPAIPTGRARYRTACGTFADRPFWVGGSAVSYNYDAVAYNGSGVVSPSGDLAVLHGDGSTLQSFSTPNAAMDLRGLGELPGGGFHVCGGIGANAEVLSTNWLARPTVVVDELVAGSLKVFPVPSNGLVFVEPPTGMRVERYAVFNASGQEVRSGPWGARRELDLSGTAPGIYVLQLFGTTAVSSNRFWIMY